MTMVLKSRNHATHTVVVVGSGFSCSNRTWCPVCQVEVIARAVTEQLQEERKDEMAAIRAEICSEVKVLRTGIHSYIPTFSSLVLQYSAQLPTGCDTLCFFLCGRRGTYCAQTFVQEIAKVGGCEFQPWARFHCRTSRSYFSLLFGSSKADGCLGRALPHLHRNDFAATTTVLVITINSWQGLTSAVDPNTVRNENHVGPPQVYTAYI